MSIGSIVIALYMPHLGTGIVVDITKTGLLRVLFDHDDYCDAFHPMELELSDAYAATA